MNVEFCQVIPVLIFLKHMGSESFAAQAVLSNVGDDQEVQ